MQDKDTEEQWAQERIQKLVDGSRPVHTLTTYGSGMTDYVRVFVVGDDYRLVELTYLLSLLTTYRLKRDKGLALGGGNYSKGLDVFLSVCHVAGVDADQGQWEQI